MSSDQPIFTRRRFINHGLTLIGAGVTVPSYLFRTASAIAGDDLTSPGTKRTDHRILVIIQLAGGNDGLNTLVPFTDDNYYKLRPKLAIEKDKVLKLDRDFGFHPSATGLKSLFDDGQLAIVRGVGYPNPDRSHFRSTDIWATASPSGKLHEGWLGRYFDCECQGRDPIDPKSGLALTEEIPLAMRGQEFLPIAFETPSRLSMKGPKGKGRADDMFDREAHPEEGDGKPEGMSTLDYLRRTALEAKLSAGDIRAAADRKSCSVEFPRSALGQSMQTIHRLIAAGMPTKIYYAALGGFDTHSQQAGRHGNLLAELGSALQAFTAALKESGDLDRVLLMTFSEFGRRVAENASAGTDHGAAAPMFLLGGQVKPGFHGVNPSMERLVDGDLKYTVDFREVYASVLKDWMSADPHKILDGRFKTLPLFDKAQPSGKS